MKVKNLIAATVIGDVLGSYYEGTQPTLGLNNPKTLLSEQELCRILPLEEGRVRKSWTYTDDTVCSLALIRAILDAGDKAEFLRNYCNKYDHPFIGYGGTFRKWLKNKSMPPYGSNANGCLMRIGFVPMLSQSEQEAIDLALECTRITHNHPQAEQATIDFMQLCFKLKSKRGLRCLEEYLAENKIDYTAAYLRSRKVFEMGARETLFMAVVCLKEANSFKEVLLNCLNVGGDTDTLAVVALNLAQHIYPVDNDLLEFSLNILKEASSPLFNELSA